MIIADISAILDLKTLLVGFIGALVALSLNSVAKAWKYAKELNKYREIILNFIDRLGLNLTEQFIAEGKATLDILRCKSFPEHKALVVNKRLEHFPMLNSDIFRDVPMTILKDMLYGKGAFVEVFTFYHCLDYMMEVTPVKAYMDNHDFFSAHLKEKHVTTHEAIVHEFETCPEIEARRVYDAGRLDSRIRRAEMNLKFLRELGKELRGSRLAWQAKYFFRTLL